MIGSSRIERQKTVLVVDDQEINRDALGAILEDQYEILYAENGQEALEMMNRYMEEISIVLLDLIMPVMNGFEVLDRVREDEALRAIPVIVLTAEREMELRALQAGAADFLTKPFDEVEIILARVGRVIELSEGRKLISAAEHDRLTGLYNRSFFLEYSSRLFRYHSEMRLDALALDVEQFQSINALHGRAFGDEVLRAVGKEILTFLRETEGIASRIEADRFSVFCLRQKDYPALLERFQKGISGRFPGVSIRLRMGVGPWAEDTEIGRAHV